MNLSGLSRQENIHRIKTTCCICDTYIAPSWTRYDSMGNTCARCNARILKASNKNRLPPPLFPNYNAYVRWSKQVGMPKHRELPRALATLDPSEHPSESLVDVVLADGDARLPRQIPPLGTEPL